MERTFNKLCESLFSKLDEGENLVLSLNGENSQFVRFNNASIRQTGLVDDADLGLKFIANGRTCNGGFTISGDSDLDLKRGLDEIERMRGESKEIPKDPFLVMPTDSESSRELKTANGLPFEDAVDCDDGQNKRWNRQCEPHFLFCTECHGTLWPNEFQVNVEP